MSDLNAITSELRLYDDAGTILWSNELPDTQVFGVLVTGDTIVLASAVGSDSDVVPSATAFTAEGGEAWTFAPDPNRYGLQGGLFTDVALAPDGAMVFAGSLDDLAVDRFEPPPHAFVIRYTP